MQVDQSVENAHCLSDMESYEGPNDTTTAKIKVPEMETHKSFLWRSCTQCHAICHGGAPPMPSQTSNAACRDHSPSHSKARPHEYVPGTAAPVTITGSRAMPPPPPSPPPPSRPISAPAEDFLRGVKRDITHYEEFKRDDQWDEWSGAFIATIDMHGCKNVINSRLPLSDSPQWTEHRMGGLTLC